MAKKNKEEKGEASKEKEEKIELDEDSLEALTEELEGSTDEIEIEHFSDFMTSSVAGEHAVEMPNPILSSDVSTGALGQTENMEETLENVPAPARAGAAAGEQAREESLVYNMPDYTGAHYENTRQEEIEQQRDMQMNITHQQLRQETADNLRKIDFDQWQREMVREDMHFGGQRRAAEEYHVRVGVEKKEDKLPFQDKKYLEKPGR